jgi:predicted CXXCH cytochrome family protein
MKPSRMYRIAISIITVVLSATLTAPAAAAKKEDCTFSAQLDNPLDRMQFVTKLTLAKQDPDMLTGIPTTESEFVVNVVGQFGQPMEVDTFSYDCMTCHDGVSATAHNVRFRNTRSSGIGGLESVAESHPIGMDYGSFAAGNRSFRGGDGLVFVAGKVGCLSCHDPLNREGYHLAKNNDGSALCFSCHNK